MEHALLPDLVVRERPAVLELLARKDTKGLHKSVWSEAKTVNMSAIAFFRSRTRSVACMENDST